MIIEHPILFYKGTNVLQNFPLFLQVPIVIPVLVLLVSVYLTMSPVISTGRVTFLYAVLFILSGLFVYFPLVYFKTKIPQVGMLINLFSLFKNKMSVL